MRIGSLFSGIGGLELGLEMAEVGQVAWQCESDPYCRRVLRKHWPDVICYPDIKAFDGAAADVICGGFPCQDISYAGNGAGIDGDRSGLWQEMLRVVCAVRPKYVFVENVSALLSRGLDVVLGDLASAGYDAVWTCLQAAVVGAPHLRDRVFVLAYPSVEGLGQHGHQQTGTVSVEGSEDPKREDAEVPDSNSDSLWDQSGGRSRKSGQSSSKPRNDGQVGDVSYPKVSAFRAGLRSSGPRGQRRGRSGDTRGSAREQLDSSAVCDTGCELPQGWEPATADQFAGYWAVEPDVGRVAHGVPKRVDRLRALGNAVVPQQAAVAWSVLYTTMQEVTHG